MLRVVVEFLLMQLQFVRSVVNTVARLAHEDVNFLKIKEKYYRKYESKTLKLLEDFEELV